MQPHIGASLSVFLFTVCVLLCELYVMKKRREGRGLDCMRDYMCNVYMPRCI